MVPMAAPAICSLGLIADDLTGANDTAVQFARRGWKTLLTLDGHGGPGAAAEPVDRSVLAMTTDARALENDAAERLTASAAVRLMEAGVDRIYLKIDSTMRGSVPGQIAGALAAWQSRHPNASAVVCPAYPRMGRTVVGNRLLVNGRPVEQSAISRDPVSPVSTSDLAALIPGSTHARPGQPVHQASVVATVDASSDEDLASLAAAIADAGPAVIPVGSAGLAEAMATVWSVGMPPATPLVHPGGIGHFPHPRVLIQVTSLNPVSRAQVERLAEVFPEVVVLLAPAERVGNSSVAEQLAGAFADRVAQETWDVLGLVGGDGARAALRRLDASAIRIVDAMLEGIPLGFVVGGRADGMPIFTKAGGFGAEDALVRVVERIKA